MIANFEPQALVVSRKSPNLTRNEPGRALLRAGVPPALFGPIWY